MRKIIATISVFLLFFAMAGHYLAFRLQRHQLKLEMKRNIRMLRNSRDLVAFTFDEPSYASLEWEEENEFRFKGEMYDVVEKKLVNGKIELLCIPDDKETRLLQDFQKHVEKDQSRSKRLVAKWVINYLPPVACTIPISPRLASSNLYCDYIVALFFRPLNIFTPPPDCC